MSSVHAGYSDFLADFFYRSLGDAFHRFLRTEGI